MFTWCTWCECVGLSTILLQLSLLTLTVYLPFLFTSLILHNQIPGKAKIFSLCLSPLICRITKDIFLFFFQARDGFPQPPCSLSLISQHLTTTQLHSVSLVISHTTSMIYVRLMIIADKEPHWQQRGSRRKRDVASSLYITREWLKGLCWISISTVRNFTAAALWVQSSSIVHTNANKPVGSWPLKVQSYL